MITLRFVSHPGIFNWACRFAQYGLWPTHAEVMMPDGTQLSAMRDGVKARPAGYDNGEFTQEMFFNVKSSDEQNSSFYAFLRSQIGKPYDFWAIVSFYGKRSARDWQADDSWFCSELISAALAECGVFPKHIADQFNRITPRDLMLLVSAEVG